MSDRVCDSMENETESYAPAMHMLLVNKNLKFMPLSEIILILPLPQPKFLHDVDNKKINTCRYENLRTDNLIISANSFVKI